MNPLTGSARQNYNQIWQIKNKTLAGPFNYLQVSISKAFSYMYDNSYTVPQDFNLTRDVTGSFYVFNTNFSDSRRQGMYFAGKMYYDPGVYEHQNQSVRGIMQGIFPYRNWRPEFNISKEQYANLFDFSQDFPNLQQSNISDEAIRRVASGNYNYFECELFAYLTISPAFRKIAENKYMPDYQMMRNESSPFNATHEMVSQLQSRIISQNCAVDMV